ncbi:uncharacterized protein LOC117783656 [Drosophila innubila]|uniref:uncharacterized protein LOC117783656 n=1 Tax=Drosophila innubila TaxID=198719 RepID=UPI00148C4298|nr:uncharacterized protein LOC117783656 [Drosophila innubila]
MSSRNRLTASNMIETPRGNRLAAPLSSHKTGARQRAGGDGDGGTAIWKTAPVSTATCRITSSARQEKPTIASTLRAASIRNKALSQKPITPRKPRPPTCANGDRKFPDRLSAIPASRQTDNRLWSHRKTAGGAPMLKKEKPDEMEIDVRTEDQPASRLLDTGIQTNEAEILNRDLLVGDIKLLMPSAQVSKQIEKMRWETKNKLERETKRKFASHEYDEEQHLDELKEYMERSYVTRRTPKKPSPNLSSYEPNPNRNVFKYMDECFTREVPKAESITNIQDRIKRKEIELMSMFDDVDVHEKSEPESEGD